MKKFLSFGIIATFVLALLFAIPMQTKAADSRVIELQAQINKLSSIIETLKANRTLQGMVKGAFTIPGDVNGDGTVNITDLNAVISAWGPCVSKICPADLNNNGIVNIDDLTIVINNWSKPLNVTVSSASAVLGTCYGGNMTYVDNKCPMTMTFTVFNIGNSDVYISKTPAIALSTSTSIASGPFPVASSTLSSINITAAAGDTPTSYRVASSASRTFTYQGTLSKNAAGGFQSFKITAVKYGASNIDGQADIAFNSQTLTPNSNSSSKINSGLENLFVSNTFGAI